MTATTVLLVEADGARRRELARRLAELGREVVPAVTAAEARRFLSALEGDVAVVSPSFAPDAASDPGAGLGDGDFGAASLFYEAGLAPGEPPFERAVNGVVLGLLRLDLGSLGADLTPDPARFALLGEVGTVPFLELVRALGSAAFTGSVVVAEGEIALARGEVARVRAGAVRGVKAFCRLAQQAAGELRVVPSPVPLPRELDRPLPDLVLAALEDRLSAPPDPLLHVRVLTGSSFFDSALSPLDRELLGTLQEAQTVGALLDALPQRNDGEILRALSELARRGVVALDPPRGVLVITDTASDLGPEVAAAEGIRLLPYTLSWGGTRVRDREEIAPAELYRRLSLADGPPAVEPPGRGELFSVFSTALASQDLVSIHAAPRLGSALGTARIAAEDALGARSGLAPAAIEVIDSRSASLGQGLLALAAARLAARGASAPAIRQQIEALGARSFAFVAAREDARGSRRLRDFFIRPAEVWAIYEIAGGELLARRQEASGEAARAALADLAAERFSSEGPLWLGLAHAAAPAAAEHLRALVAKRWPLFETLSGEIGPPLGTTFGAGAVLLAIVQLAPGEADLFAREVSGATPRGRPGPC